MRQSIVSTVDQYLPFSTITLHSLHHALAETSTSLDQPAIDSLMHAYDSLSTFPDVPEALSTLTSHSNITAVVFSNGTDSMVSNSVQKSPDLSPHASAFTDLVTVEAVKKFKPSPDVYYHLAEKMGKGREEMGEMWLVSGNPFDVVGARAVGMRAAWVDREGNGWSDGLIAGELGKPTLTGGGLGDIVDKIVNFNG